MITVNNLVHHEFIGLSVSVTSVSNESLRLKGTVIDETKNTIKIEVDDNVEKIIPKKGSIFVFELPTGEKVEINGNILSIRPEDRIKKDLKKYKYGDNMVGLNVQEPETTCDDPNCPFHGTLPLRGQVLEGIVVSNKAERTISVERSYYKFIKKYERYEKRKSKINVHKPDCLSVNVGDSVKVAECRPLSKTKHFVLVEVKGE